MVVPREATLPFSFSPRFSVTGLDSARFFPSRAPLSAVLTKLLRDKVHPVPVPPNYTAMIDSVTAPKENPAPLANVTSLSQSTARATFRTVWERGRHHRPTHPPLGSTPARTVKSIRFRTRRKYLPIQSRQPYPDSIGAFRPPFPSRTAHRTAT